MPSKTEIRLAMKARRKAVPATARAAVSSAICAKLLARDDVRAAIAEKSPIAVYLASPDEIDLTDFIAAALAQGAVLVAPRWNGESYELAPLTSLDNLVSGPHGILEPRSGPLCLSVKVWLVPGLAFTKDGKRIGYGGGWYDRFLSSAATDSVMLGIAYRFQVFDDFICEAHDVRLTGLVI